MPARAVAHVLLEAHQRQRKTASTTERGVVSPVSPTANGTVHQGGHECYERFQCVFVGSCVVGTGQGMDMLNGAVEKLSLDQRQWQEVSLDVAISNITITDKV